MHTAIPAVLTRGLTKTFGGNRGIISLDLNVERGEIFGFIGPNGAGKSTTMRILMDHIRPTDGDAAIFGLDCHRDPVAIHARVGYLPGDLQLFERLTGADLLDWFGCVRGGHDRRYVEHLAARLALDLSRRVGELSTGNRQKIGIVQAFMHRPELLILDEPSAGLDPVVRRELHDLLEEVRDEGSAVLLSSHVLGEVDQICDRVGTIVDGRLRRIDTVAELRALSRRNMQLIYTGRITVEEVAAIPGVSNVSATYLDDLGETVVTLEMSGRVDPILKHASNYEIRDLTSTPISLANVFLETYDNRQSDTAATKRPSP